MAKFEQLLAPNVWTDLTATLIAACGSSVVLRTDVADMKIGLKATAPIDGIALTPREGIEVNIKVGDTLKLWARSVAGGKIEGETQGARRVVWDGTGTT